MASTPAPAPQADDGESGPKGAGRAYYAPRFDDPASPRTASRYLFFSSQRTGSTYLCRRLCNVKDRFGLPSEYLNANALEEFAPRIAVPRAPGGGLRLVDYLHGVERLRTTADGVFGIKVQPRQLLASFPKGGEGLVKFLQTYDRIIVLTRRDKLGQAVSGAIAEATGDWATGSKPPDMTDAELEKLCPDVAYKLNRYVEEELRMKAAAAQTGRPVMHMEYEEILANADASFDKVLRFLGEAGGMAAVEEGDTVTVPKKSGGELARRLSRRFLDFITADGPYAVPGAEALVRVDR